MKSIIPTIITAFLMALTPAFLSCEKMDLTSDENDDGNVTANLIIKVLGTDDESLTRADGDPWNRLHFVVYQNGSKVADKTQVSGDEGYGQASMTLAEGTYELLVLAHSSNGNPSLASAEKLQFTNAMGFTDTFFSYGDITVTSQPQTHNITLSRVTAMLRFIINDDIPENMKSIKFYYTGGSGALNAKTGLGCVASKQTVVVNVEPSALTKPYTFDLYTIPREESAKLSLTVTAYDEAQNVLCERAFKDILIGKNKITEFAGDFFSFNVNPGDENKETQQTGQETFLISADTKWDETISQTY